jgi:hypothetical protein
MLIGLALRGRAIDHTHYLPIVGGRDTVVAAVHNQRDAAGDRAHGEDELAIHHSTAVGGSREVNLTEHIGLPYKNVLNLVMSYLHKSRVRN